MSSAQPKTSSVAVARPGAMLVVNSDEEIRHLVEKAIPEYHHLSGCADPLRSMRTTLGGGSATGEVQSPEKARDILNQKLRCRRGQSKRQRMAQVDNRLIHLCKQFVLLHTAFVLCLMMSSTIALCGVNEVLGEIQFVGASKVEKTSGVWVDGQYVGYLKELKGSKKVLLLPGEHEIVVRQAGFKDFTQKIVLEPGQKQVANVAMAKDPQAQYPDITAEVKFKVKPNRAAVFVDDRFVGFVDQFDGPGQWLLLASGKHQVKITLPGYKTFDTEINLLPNQKFELKTDLFKGSIMEAGPLMKGKGAEAQAK
jgi:hypothetical protein